MRKIKITIQDLNGSYYIPVDLFSRDCHLRFNTKRSAVSFQRKYQKFINDSATNMLNIYSETLSLYFDVYVYLTSYTSNEIYQINLRIQKQIDLLFRENDYCGYNLDALEGIWYKIHEIINTLKSFSQRYKHQILQHRINKLSLNYWNNFNNHRKTQESLLVDLNYRKTKTLQITYKKIKSKISSS